MLKWKLYLKIADCLVSCLGLGVLCILPNNATVWSVVMFGVIGFALGALAGGPGVNQIDLSPRFAGVLQAITNTTSSVFSFVGPLVVQFIVTDEVSRGNNLCKWFLKLFIIFIKKCEFGEI